MKSYVLRAGRITDAQRRALEGLTERYCIPFSDNRLNLKREFGGKPIICEIGFGMGGATAEIAATNPDKAYLALEVFPAGVGRLLNEIDTRNLLNLRIIRYDAMAVFESMIPNNSLSGIHLFFPDPWQKKRHHKRRILQQQFAKLMMDKLLPDGYCYVVTDWENYAADIVDVFAQTDGIKNSYGGFAPPLAWRPKTKFEKKAMEKGKPIFEVLVEKKRVVQPEQENSAQ